MPEYFISIEEVSNCSPDPGFAKYGEVPDPGYALRSGRSEVAELADFSIELDEADIYDEAAVDEAVEEALKDLGLDPRDYSWDSESLHPVEE